MKWNGADMNGDGKDSLCADLKWIGKEGIWNRKERNGTDTKRNRDGIETTRKDKK